MNKLMNYALGSVLAISIADTGMARELTQAQINASRKCTATHKAEVQKCKTDTVSEKQARLCTENSVIRYSACIDKAQRTAAHSTGSGDKPGQQLQGLKATDSEAEAAENTTLNKEQGSSPKRLKPTGKYQIKTGVQTRETAPSGVQDSPDTTDNSVMQEDEGKTRQHGYGYGYRRTHR